MSASTTIRATTEDRDVVGRRGPFANDCARDLGGTGRIVPSGIFLDAACKLENVLWSKVAVRLTTLFDDLVHGAKSTRVRASRTHGGKNGAAEHVQQSSEKRGLQIRECLGPSFRGGGWVVDVKLGGIWETQTLAGTTPLLPCTHGRAIHIRVGRGGEWSQTQNEKPRKHSGH